MPFITPLELKENKTSDKITIVFGRFQPPTLGHKALFDAAIEKGIIENSDVILVPTRTCEKRKIEETNIGENIKTQLSKSKDLCSTIRYPLKYDEKKHFIKTLYPESIFPNYYFLEIPETRIEGLNLNVYIDLLIFLNKYVGYKELYFIAGDDRVDSFQSDIEKRNNEGKLFKFDKFHGVTDIGKGRRVTTNILETDVELSGTMVRFAAILGLSKMFYESIKTYNDLPIEITNQLMITLRNGLGIKAPLINISEESEKQMLEHILKYLEPKTSPKFISNKRQKTTNGGFYFNYLWNVIRNGM